MKKIVVAHLWAILCFASVAFSVEGPSKAAAELFTQANKAYEHNNYDQAVSLYENIISQDKAPGDSVYYNLGNCYYRLNKIGKAVLSYEQALKLNPRDEDARYNLNYIRTLIKDVQETNIFDRLFALFTANELFLLFTFLNIAFFVMFWLLIIRKNVALKTYCLYTGIAILLLGFWVYSKAKDESRMFAVVITTPCEIRSGPGKEYTAGMSVQEGKKVEILGGQDYWYAVGLHTEKHKGWLEKDKVELIQ